MTWHCTLWLSTGPASHNQHLGRFIGDSQWPQCAGLFQEDIALLSWSANRCTTNKEVYLAKGATSRYDMWVTCTLLMSGIYMDRWHSWSTDSYTADDGVYLDKRASRRRNLALICCKYKNWVLALKKDIHNIQQFCKKLCSPASLLFFSICLILYLTTNLLCIQNILEKMVLGLPSGLSCNRLYIDNLQIKVRVTEKRSIGWF